MSRSRNKAAIVIAIPALPTSAYLPLPAYLRNSISNKASGNRPPTILDPFDIFYRPGGWRAKCRYDKAGLSGHYGPSVGLIVLPWDGLVRRPYVPGPCAWPREGFVIEPL